MKKVAKKIALIVSSIVGPVFYDKRYLSGRWFENNLTGWRWMWRGIVFQKLLGYNRRIRWPVSGRIYINNGKNIEFDNNDLNNFQSFGIYFQNFKEKIVIGKGTYIGPNVGLITANHDVGDKTGHSNPQPIVLGERCWVGMNAVILPGVELGANTVVGAGAIVTKSFKEGNVVIAGNPAKVIRSIAGTEA